MILGKIPPSRGPREFHKDPAGLSIGAIESLVPAVPLAPQTNGHASPVP